MNAEFRKQAPQQHSFNELALSYVASHVADMSDVQRHRRLEHLGSYLLTFFGAFALRDISPTKLQKFTYHLEELGLKDKEIQACLVSFRMCVKHALQKHWDVDPALLQPVKMDDGFLPEPKQLSDQEYSLLYQALLQDITGDFFH
jgi:hypothetical protein